MHDRRSVVFHRPLADVEIGRDILVGMTGENHVHDFELAGREGLDLQHCVL